MVRDAEAVQETEPATSGLAFIRDAEGPDALSRLSRYEMAMVRNLLALNTNSNLSRPRGLSRHPARGSGRKCVPGPVGRVSSCSLGEQIFGRPSRFPRSRVLRWGKFLLGLLTCPTRVGGLASDCFSTFG